MWPAAVRTVPQLCRISDKIQNVRHFELVVTQRSEFSSGSVLVTQTTAVVHKLLHCLKIFVLRKAAFGPGLGFFYKTDVI